MTTASVASISSRAGATEGATTAITLEITREDIETGVKEDCGACPIAIAFKRTCPGTAAVSVGSMYLTFRTMDGKEYNIRLPLVAQDFVQTHDHGPEVASPFWFTLAIPSHLVNTPGFLSLDESEWAPVDLTPGGCPG